MMPRKRHVILLLALCAAFVLGGCGQIFGPDEPVETITEPTPAPTATPRPIANFTMFSALTPDNTNIWDTPVGEKLLELTHTYVDVQFLGGDSLQSQIDAMIASGDLPDLIMAGGETKKLADAGLLVDLSDYVASSELVQRRYREAEFAAQNDQLGGVYTFPVNRFTADARYPSIGYYVNFDVLAFNEYPKIDTYVDYATVLKKYMAENPYFDQENKIKNIAFAMPMASQADLFYNTALSLVRGNADDGKITVRDATGSGRFVATSNDVREYLEFLNDLWRHKYIDDSFFTMTEEEYLEALASGRVLGCFDTRAHIQPAMDALVEGELSNRTYLACPVVLDGVTNDYYTGMYTLDLTGISITTSCHDVDAAFAFLERLCADDAQKLMAWGIEGEDYTYEAQGEAQVMTLSAEQLSARSDPAAMAARGIGQFSFFPQAETSEDEYYGQFDDYNWVNPLLQRRYLKTFYAGYETEILGHMGMESFTDGFARPNVPTRDNGRDISGRMETDEAYALTAQGVQGIVENYYPQLIKADGHKKFDEIWNKMQGELDAMQEQIAAYEAEFSRQLEESRAAYGAGE